MEFQRLVCIPGKYKWQVKYSIVYTRTCYKLTILHLAIEITVTITIDAAQDGRVECNTFAVYNGFSVFWLAVFSIHFLYVCTRTSEANDSLFFSPPEIPRNRPGIPMYVSAHLVRPSFGKKNEWQWISLFPDFTWFGWERFGWQFYFMLPNWHSPPSPRWDLL